MTELFHAPSPIKRSRTDMVVTAACIAAVAVGAIFSRKTGACGTGHYVLFQLLGGMVMGLIEEVWVSHYSRLIANVSAYVLNVAAFSALTLMWYRRASQERYVFGVLALAALYLLSYFFLLPTVDCP